VIKAARRKKIPVLVDPHLKTPAGWYAGATLLTPNKKEAEALAGVKIVDSQSLMQAGSAILRQTRAESLIITLGKEGMAIFKGPGVKPILIPTFAREVYDVSGAGDTVISVLALSLASGAKLEEAAYISNLAAGVEVSKRGTATVSPQEITEAYLHSRG
jgi:D-beta-D-heptose 7-phosphate kinase/D-beta-D-heptose 1-phosphate adenosyltransferase